MKMVRCFYFFNAIIQYCYVLKSVKHNDIFITLVKKIVKCTDEFIRTEACHHLTAKDPSTAKRS